MGKTNNKTKMKTLKDKELKTLENIGKITKSGAFVCNFKELKKEVVKWIKDKYNPDKTTMEIVDWIDFFNLTEEDLFSEYLEDHKKFIIKNKSRQKDERLSFCGNKEIPKKIRNSFWASKSGYEE